MPEGCRAGIPSIDGEISINIEKTEKEISVSIADSGEGMDRKTQKHLFDPYFQGDASHSKEGLGLGLSIAKRITELCQGKIIVESEVGAGSKFTIKLPVN